MVVVQRHFFIQHLYLPNPERKTCEHPNALCGMDLEGLAFHPIDALISGIETHSK